MVSVTEMSRVDDRACARQRTTGEKRPRGRTAGSTYSESERVSILRAICGRRAGGSFGGSQGVDDQLGPDRQVDGRRVLRPDDIHATQLRDERRAPPLVECRPSAVRFLGSANRSACGHRSSGTVTAPSHQLDRHHDSHDPRKAHAGTAESGGVPLRVANGRDLDRPTRLRLLGWRSRHCRGVEQPGSSRGS